VNSPEPDLGLIGIWAGDLDNYPMADVRTAAAAIEDFGYGALWFPETTGREAMAQAGILLSATQRITVAAGAADIYARDAVTTAAAQRTLEEAFPGRFLLGLWESLPPSPMTSAAISTAAPETMSGYLDAVDAAPFGPPPAPEMPGAPRRILSVLDPDMFELAGRRAWCAHQMGMPAEYTARSRAVLGPNALLAVTQFVILDAAGSHSADLARTCASAALPNRCALLQDLGFEDVDSLNDRLVDALIARGTADDIAHRVTAHFRRRRRPREPLRPHGRTRDPPTGQWQELAARLLA